MKRNLKYLGIATFAVALIFQSCKKEANEIDLTEPVGNNTSDESQAFVPKYGRILDPFPGGGRKYAVSFGIGNKIYMGFGFSDSGPVRDLWVWDPSEWVDEWTKLPDFPGSCPQGISLGFAVNGKGYVLPNAYNQNENLVQEFWEFDPESKAWTQKANPPATLARSSATGFSIGSKFYIGTGEKNSGGTSELFRDFWEWDQTTDTWTQKGDAPGPARAYATGFSIGEKGYFGLGGELGFMGGGTYNHDFWEYNPKNDSWTRKAVFPGFQQMDAVAFSVGNKGYVTAGWDPESESASTQDIWEWDQTTDKWTKVGIFEGDPRTGGVGCTMGNWGYLITGQSLTSGLTLNDFWEFDLTSF